MGYFNSSQSKWIIGFLVLLNIVTLTSIFLSKDKPKGPHIDRHPGKTEQLLRKELELSDEQFEKVKTLREQHFAEVKAVLKKIRKTKSQMFSALEGAIPDTAAANLSARRVGDLESQIDHLLIKHFMDLREICNPEQRLKLEKVFKKAIRKPGPKHPPRDKKRRPPRDH